LRTVPLTSWRWIVRQTTMMTKVNDEDAALTWVKEWFLAQEFLKKIRHLDLETKIRGERVEMIPVPGRHWFWHGGRPFIIYFYRSEDKKHGSYSRSEELTFPTIDRNQEFLKRFVDEISQCRQNKVCV